MNRKEIQKPILYGIAASGLLLAIYFAVLTLVSGWEFAQSQFFSFWPFILSLTVGFGTQVGLYAYLKNLAKEASGKMLGITGTTSTAAIVSCCAHYLVNLLPILGVTGVATLITQYQRQLFWVGLLFNIGGILYMFGRVKKFKHAHI